MPYKIPVIRPSAGGKIAFCDSFADVALEHRRWVAGPFVITEDGEPLTDDFEVMISRIPAGARRDEWSSIPNGDCFMAVLQGVHKMTFLVDGREHCQIVSTGQSLLYSNNIPHRWEAIEDVFLFAVRIPPPKE